MHKFFAKTLFLGKNVIYLPQCHSTNDELMQLIRNGDAKPGDIVITDNQLSGRGQRGNAWISKPGQNLLFSMCLRPRFLPIHHQHYLTILAGLALSDALREAGVREVMIKWPNDIFTGGRKICGILTECILSGTVLEHAVVGIGLNCNQTSFEELEATSLKLETGNSIDRESLLETIASKFEKWYFQLEGGRIEDITQAYYAQLMWLNELHTFRDDGGEFAGYIRGIDERGRLHIDKKGVMLSFAIKDIEFIR